MTLAEQVEIMHNGAYHGRLAEIVAEGRAWLCDCVWADVDGDEIEQMSAERILRAVNRHFDGGLESFLRCSIPG